jgi:hypothetical protein
MGGEAVAAESDEEELPPADVVAFVEAGVMGTCSLLDVA